MAIQEPAVACVPSAIPAGERAAHFELAKGLFGERARQRMELPNGMAFTWPIGELAAVARFVENERKCCPFVSFDMAIPARAEAVSLRMTGPQGTREVLIAELDLKIPCSCP
ncbi:MAG: hypothetical protein ACRETY_01280 [Steroidobacteraceae bacterium]